MHHQDISSTLKARFFQSDHLTMDTARTVTSTLPTYHSYSHVQTVSCMYAVAHYKRSQLYTTKDPSCALQIKDFRSAPLALLGLGISSMSLFAPKGAIIKWQVN